jgi:alkanesulfonate monooxygenase SsuD/methylene tetrahydromethanopterin reductase-like flavin-dependent oxidoreductase (luciferase family)
VDLSAYAIDEEFKFDGTHYDNSIQGVIDNIKVISQEKIFTPRVVAEMFALGGSGPRPVGTPEMVADFFEQWWREGDLDGFNLNCKALVPMLMSNLTDSLVRRLEPWKLRGCRGAFDPRTPKAWYLLV